MEKSLFRKKSLDRISSPEELHDYMRVTSPRLWMLLGAIIALLVGFIVYASTATMENTYALKVRISQYEIGSDSTGKSEYITGMEAFLPHSMKDMVDTGMTVRIGRIEGKVGYVGVKEDDTLYLNIEPTMDYVPLPEGEYDAELVLESTTPISFLWN